VDPGAAADDADERLLVPALLFEAELDGLDGIRRRPALSTWPSSAGILAGLHVLEHFSLDKQDGIG
jgi:hypothetical protein